MDARRLADIRPCTTPRLWFTTTTSSPWRRRLARFLGPASVTATDTGKTATVTLTVTPGPVGTLTIAPASTNTSIPARAP